jgi:hypothetical protein
MTQLRRLPTVGLDDLRVVSIDCNKGQYNEYLYSLITGLLTYLIVTAGLELFWLE